VRILPTTGTIWIESACAHLRASGVVALPTDTLYGLAAELERPDGANRIFTLKERDKDRSLPWQVASLVHAEASGFAFSPAARRLAERFWPGPLTLVLPRPARCPAWFAPGSPRIALRIPGHRVPLALLEAFGAPLAVTSANLSGGKECLSPSEVAAAFGGADDLLILDGGLAPGGMASTVVDASGAEPVLLREGPVPFASVLEVWHVER